MAGVESVAFRWRGLNLTAHQRESRQRGFAQGLAKIPGDFEAGGRGSREHHHLDIQHRAPKIAHREPPDAAYARFFIQRHLLTRPKQGLDEGIFVKIGRTLPLLAHHPAHIALRAALQAPHPGFAA